MCAADGPERVARPVLAGTDHQAIAGAAVAALATPERSTEAKAAALGDRAGEVGRLLAARTRGKAR